MCTSKNIINQPGDGYLHLMNILWRSDFIWLRYWGVTPGSTFGDRHTDITQTLLKFNIDANEKSHNHWETWRVLLAIKVKTKFSFLEFYCQRLSKAFSVIAVDFCPVRHDLLSIGVYFFWNGWLQLCSRGQKKIYFGIGIHSYFGTIDPTTKAIFVTDFVGFFIFKTVFWDQIVFGLILF